MLVPGGHPGSPEGWLEQVELGGDDWGLFRRRARQILQRSRDPARCLQLMKLRVGEMFGQRIGVLKKDSVIKGSGGGADSLHGDLSGVQDKFLGAEFNVSLVRSREETTGMGQQAPVAGNQVTSVLPSFALGGIRFSLSQDCAAVQKYEFLSFSSPHWKGTIFGCELVLQGKVVQDVLLRVDNVITFKNPVKQCKMPPISFDPGILIDQVQWSWQDDATDTNFGGMLGVWGILSKHHKVQGLVNRCSSKFHSVRRVNDQAKQSPGNSKARCGISFSLGSAGSATKNGKGRSSAINKEQDQAYSTGSRAPGDHHIKRRDPPDRRKQPDRLSTTTTASLAAMAAYAITMEPAPKATEENLESGGGDHGAPNAVAARPKPVEGETEVPAAADPNALALVAAGQEGVTQAAFVSASDSMEGNESVLGKRQMHGMLGFDFVANEENALVPFVDNPAGGLQKKGKVEVQPVSHEVQQPYVVDMPMEDDASSMVREVDKEATGHGAAGNLTGPSVAPCQEQ